MRNAPVLILVWTSEQAYLDRYAEPDKGWTDRDPGRWSAPYWFVDGGMAAMAALLAAVDRGLGACFFGVPAGPDRRGASRVRGPGDQLSVGVISLGYAGAGAAPSARPTRRPRRPRGTADPPRILACELSHMSGKRLGCVAGDRYDSVTHSSSGFGGLLCARSFPLSSPEPLLWLWPAATAGFAAVDKDVTLSLDGQTTQVSTMAAPSALCWRARVSRSPRATWSPRPRSPS